MELRVHLKICEACGCLWFRAQVETTVYCSACYERFKDFPTPAVRRRKGRPKKTTLPTVFAVEASSPSLAEGMPGARNGFGPALAFADGAATATLMAAQAAHSNFGSISAGAL